MACGKICALFVCLSGFAALIEYNEAHPAPGLPNAGLPNAESLNEPGTPNTDSPNTNYPGTESMLSQRAEEVGEYISKVPVDILAEQLQQLSSDEVEQNPNAIPQADVQEVVAKFLRIALQQLKENDPQNFPQTQTSLENLPDVELPAVAAGLDSSSIKILEQGLLENLQNGYLFVNLPPRDIGNFINGLSPETRQKFLTLPLSKPAGDSVPGGGPGVPGGGPGVPGGGPAPGKPGKKDHSDNLILQILGFNGLVGNVLGLVKELLGA